MFSLEEMRPYRNKVKEFGTEIIQFILVAKQTFNSSLLKINKQIQEYTESVLHFRTLRYTVKTKSDKRVLFQNLG